jgi:hypothetical protein
MHPLGETKENNPWILGILISLLLWGKKSGKSCLNAHCPFLGGKLIIPRLDLKISFLS